MTSSTAQDVYSASLVPALQEIQHKFGYLERGALEKYSAESGVPLYRLQEVASFFPHFFLSPPKKVTLRVCRDMACHMAGSAKMLTELEKIAGDQVTIEGVSCAGRCDRAPAACVTVAGDHHEHYYLGRSVDQLKAIVTDALKTKLPEANRDADYNCWHGDSIINPYPGESDYAAVRKVLAARDASLQTEMEALRAKGWDKERCEQFRACAVRQMRVDPLPTEIARAVRMWQREADWAQAFFNEMKDATLRGLGGAGIPADTKWRDVRDAVRNLRVKPKDKDDPKDKDNRAFIGADDRAFIVVNGDESEPGTFKDRELLLRTPHLIVEAVIVAGLLTEARQGFIYIRHEYHEQIEACRKEIQRAEALGLCGKDAAQLGRPFWLEVFVSPGGYICGEQSALIEAMSDRRGEPRNMPPKLETNGLEDRPTLVSNVETYAWVPFIIIKGGKTYAEKGVNECKGRRLFSISGDVNRPGVYEVEMGLTLRELVEDQRYCQGITGGRKLKAFAPSGPSGGFLPARLKAPRNPATNKAWQTFAARHQYDLNAADFDILDLELELNLFRALSPTGALGAGLVVYAEGRDMVAEAVKSLEFFRNESCGKCVPCRIGSQKFATLGTNLMAGRISAERWKNELVPLVGEMSRAIELASICGLGRSVPMPWKTVLSYFPDDVKQYLTVPAAAAKEANP